MTTLNEQLSVHATWPLGEGFRHLIEARLSATLRGLDSRLGRVVVRFEDLNGPKGGEDTACRIQIALNGHSVLVVEARAEGEEHAFRLAVPKLTAALNRQLDRRRTKPRTTVRSLHAGHSA
jgi:ribosome-associated translation inhibitor RaiA